LGIMTYEMLTGEQPYVGEAPMQIAYQHANDTVPMPSGKVPSIPRELDELVLWSTARDPEQRPRDARVMLDQLHDVEKLVRPTADTGMAATLMFPGGFGAAAANADTQILGALPLASTAAAPPSSSTLLATRADKRKRSGYWLLTLVVLLAAMAGGTGWYFGSGPGSQIPVPQLTSMTSAKAAAALTDIGLTSKTGGEYNNTIAEGLVSSTKPDVGTRVPKGSTVMVILSKGRQPITLPALAGLSQEAATSAITDLGALVGSTDEIFHSKRAAGAVVSASRESDDADVSAGGQYFQGLKVNLIVSLGAIPDVTGKSAADATAILKKQGLVAEAGEQRYSESIREGGVIKATANKGGALRVGDVLVLTISRGPEPVEIPNVVGKPWNEGKKILKDLGFDVKYPLAADGFATFIKVESTDPAAGTRAPKGSTVTLSPTNPFAGG
ncbi:MAG: PASTA domain-containing protein, partial [Cryobacterium sp.]